MVFWLQWLRKHMTDSHTFTQSFEGDRPFCVHAFATTRQTYELISIFACVPQNTSSTRGTNQILCEWGVSMLGSLLIKWPSYSLLGNIKFILSSNQHSLNAHQLIFSQMPKIYQFPVAIDNPYHFIISPRVMWKASKVIHIFDCPLCNIIYNVHIIYIQFEALMCSISDPLLHGEC